MRSQPVPDDFYMLMFFSAFVALATARTWHIMIAYVLSHSREALGSVGDRFVFTLSGFLPSAVVVAALFTQYSPHKVWLGCAYQYHADHLLGLVAWGTVIFHVLTVIVMAPFCLWLYRQPAYVLPYSFNLYWVL